MVLAVCIVVGTIGVTPVKADSTERIQAYIDLAAGKQISDVDINNLDLSNRDLQFLGVYISNFFVPFGTEFGASSEDTTVVNKEDIKKALQTNINFSDAMADSLTETLIGLSRSSVKRLKLCVSREYQKDLKSVAGNGADIPLNYYTALNCMLGGLKNVASWYGDSGNDVISGIADGTYKYGYFAYQSGDGYIPVFDFVIDMSSLTPSASAFIKCLESADLEMGYGFSFFDFTRDEMGTTEGDYEAKVENISNEQMCGMSTYGTELAVDCFGNIILMGGNHQYVAVPGCMNPYTWVTVDENGDTVGEGLGGTAYNMINIPSMSMAGENPNESNRLLTSASVLDNGGDVVDGGNNVLDQNMSMVLVKDFNLLFIGGSMSLEGYKESAISDISYIIDYCGGSSVGKSDFSLAVDTNGDLVITAKASKLASLNYKKMNDDYLNSDKRDKDKAEKMKDAISSLSSYPVDKSVLQENIKKAQKDATSALESGSSDKETGNSEVANIRQGVLDTSVLVSKLAKIVEDTGCISLRKVRGSIDADFSTGWFNIPESSSRDLAINAEEGYKKQYEGMTVKNYYRGGSDGIEDNWWYGKTNYICIGVAYNYFPGSTMDYTGNKKIDILDSFVFIDSLGDAHFDDSGQKTEFSTFNVEHYLQGTDISSISNSMGDWADSPSNGFTNTYKDIESGRMVIPDNSVSKEAMVGIYFTYAYSALYDTSAEGKKVTIGELGYKLNSKALPEIPDEPLTISAEAQSDFMLESIKGWTYYLLHPTEGLDYFKTWIKNKLNSFFLGWHDDMVGTRGTGSINGTTKYRGFSGYVTTPELTDIPWTNSLLDMYNTAIPFFLVLMVLVMIGAYITGVLTFQRAVIGLLIFSISVALPPVFINGAVGASNRFSSNLYGEKFTYWALVQHESYSTAIDEAADNSSYANYLKTLYEQNSKATGNQGSESVMLKWQAPKKMASLMFTEKDKSVLTGISTSNLLSGLINSTYSGESYIDDEDAVYFYRSYIDIANFSRYIHRGLAGSNPKQPVNMNLTSDITDSWDNSLKNAIQNYDTNYTVDRNVGYANLNSDGSASGTGNNILRVKLPMSSKIVSDALGDRGTIKDLSLGEYVGINQDAFNFAIPMFNVGSEQLNYYDSLETDNFNPRVYTEEDFSGLAAYGLMSENVFYYFSWYLYETGLTESTIPGGYKNLLLGDDNAGFFYNTRGNGEMKDFMDMRSLFTYIIPYLRQGNDLVREWDETYGIFTYDGVPTEEGHANDPDIVSNPELQQKYWHNLNVARLYNVYTPWVDVMYDCSYAEPEKISFLGEEYVVEDPINPSSYPADRPMIFSRSEMLDYGLKEKDLTKVEKLILECEDGMQERMFKLLNYNTFNDVVLDTAAAMNCAFEFNTTFSENSIIGANHNIYPQSFELNDFSYDAFLRFILSNTTGDSMTVGKGESFYENVVDSSSMTTILVMLVLDVLAMYAIPGFKMFFIVGIFILVILLILAEAFKVDQQQKFIKKLIKGFVQPMLLFTLVSCGMALIISWFMGEGNTAVTGSMETSISLGDPVMAMLVMIVVNCFVLFFYYKILRGILKDIKSNGKLVGAFLGGVVGSVGGMITGAFSKLGKAGGRSGSRGGSGLSSGGGSEETRGTSSSRAEQRGSTASVRMADEEYEERETDTRGAQYHDGDKPKGKEERKKDSSDIEKKTHEGLEKIMEEGKKEEPKEEEKKEG